MTMHLYACGFNGFGQICSLEQGKSAGYYVNPKHLYDAKPHETVDICVSWSSIFLVIKTGDETFLKCSCMERKPVENLERIAISNQYMLRFHKDDFKLYDLDNDEEVAPVDDNGSNFHYDKRNIVAPSYTEPKTGITDNQTDHSDTTIMRKSEATYKSPCKTSAMSKSTVKELSAQENVFYSLYVDGSLNKIEVSRDGNGLKLHHISIPLPLRTTVKQVSCGKEHVMLLTDSNQVFTFGLGSRGQLGNGDVEERKEPQEVDALSGVPIKTVSAGGWHSTVVSEDGDVYTWGWNESGQLGLPCPLLSGDSCETNGIVPLPTVIDLPASVCKVACGSRHTTVLLENKVLMASGWNKYGQLGTGDTTSHDQFTKLDISGTMDSDVMDIVADCWNTIFIYIDRPISQ